jgi:hypothetical protein
VVRERLPREEIDFESAHHPLAISKKDALSRFGIDTAEHAVEKLDPPARRNLLETLAQSRVCAGPRKKPARERAIVKPRPAHQNRPAPARVNVLDGRDGIVRVSRRGVLFGRLDDVDQVMGNPSLLRPRDFVGSDVEPAVDGRGIAADDLAAVPRRELDAEGALACGRRAQDRENRKPQTLHPEESQHHDRAEQDQQAELLRTGRKRHGVTETRPGPRCRGT